MERRLFCRHMIAGAAAAPLLLQGATLPRPAPDIVITMPLMRQPVRLSQYKGKVIALEFLLTTCPHCQRASRTLEVAYKKYGPKGFQVVGAAINAEGDPDDYQRKQGLSFPVGKVGHDTCMYFMQIPSVQRLLLPQGAFINREFQIVEQHGGEGDTFFGENEDKNITEVVERLLGVKAGAPKAAPKKS